MAHMTAKRYGLLEDIGTTHYIKPGMADYLYRSTTPLALYLSKPLATLSTSREHGKDC